MFESKLKNHSVAEIEKAIAEALTALCGDEIKINLRTLAFSKDLFSSAFTIELNGDRPKTSWLPGSAGEDGVPF